jgi:hypothetical protein
MHRSSSLQAGCRLLARGQPLYSPACAPCTSLSSAAGAGHKSIQCAGCGAQLQTRDTVAAGYIPSLRRLLALEAQADSAVAAGEARSAGSRLVAGSFSHHACVCQRCFSAKHYGRLVPLALPEASYQAYVDVLVGNRAGAGGGPGHLVVHVIDAWDFHGGLLPSLLRQLLGGGVPTLLVVNKVDLLPASAPFSRIDTWVRRQLRIAGLPSSMLAGRGIHLTSAARRTGTAGLLEDIRAEAKGRDVFVAGAPNAGKSALINALLAEAWGVGLPWAPAHLGRRGGAPGATTATLWLDELPEGYVAGDVYKGDPKALAQTLGRTRSAESSPTDTTSTGPAAPGDPVRRRGSEYGSAPPSLPGYLAGGDGEESGSALLAREVERKARHRKSKEEGEDMMVTVPIAAAAPGSGRAPPSVPFTVSPMPGTTHAVIGAALDSHGHVTLYDTPGIIADVGLQRLLEGVALLAAAEAPIAAESQPSPARSHARRHSVAKTPTAALQLLVPSKRQRLSTYRLAPGRCLWLGGLARLEWSHPDPRQHVLVTAASRLPLHTGGSEKAEDLFTRHTCDDSTGLLWPRLGPLSSSSKFGLLRFLPRRQQDEVRDFLFQDGGGVLPSHVEGAPMRLEEAPGAPIGLGLQSFLARDELEGEEDEEEEESGAMAGVPAPPPSVRLPPGAMLDSANPEATVDRRRRRLRAALVDVVVRGLGWLAITPVEVRGQAGWARTVGQGSLTLVAAKGVRVHLREPLLPYETAGLSGHDFLT